VSTLRPMSDKRSDLTRNGGFRFRRVGVPLRRFNDLFHFLLRVNWWVLLGLTFGAYTLAILFFALLYLLDPGGVEGMRPNLLDAIWFSVQTLSTIGYGGMTPVSPYSNMLVFIESFVGLVGVAVGTGVLFARLSRPTAKVGFSDVMVVHRRDGVPTLMLRMANQRNNQIVEARMTLSVLVEESTVEGDQMRRLRTLDLERDTSPLFTLTWTAFHPIVADSPLAELHEGPVDRRVRAYIVTFAGLDDTYSQTVHARKIYTPDDVQIGARFQDMLRDLPDGRVEVDHTKLSRTEPCRDAEGERLPGQDRWVPPAQEGADEEVALDVDEAVSDDDTDEVEGEEDRAG